MIDYCRCEEVLANYFSRFFRRSEEGIFADRRGVGRQGSRESREALTQKRELFLSMNS